MLPDPGLDRCKKGSVCLLDSKTFNLNKFTLDEISTIVKAENQYKSKGVVDKDVDNKVPRDKLPEEFQKILSIPVESLSNKNLLRYIEENVEGDDKVISLSIAENIHRGAIDLKGQEIDFASLTEKTLKAFFVWNLDLDEAMAKNYLHFVQKIEDCNMDKSMLLSLLVNIDESKQEDVIGSLTVSM